MWWWYGDEWGMIIMNDWIMMVTEWTDYYDYYNGNDYLYANAMKIWW